MNEINKKTLFLAMQPMSHFLISFIITNPVAGQTKLSERGIDLRRQVFRPTHIHGMKKDAGKGQGARLSFLFV
ncbi:MAG TPA: hypothetical protein P5244_10695 [Syntrophales bacterium]|nr:hypothetical protein [Syntrophales bacterium]